MGAGTAYERDASLIRLASFFALERERIGDITDREARAALNAKEARKSEITKRTQSPNFSRISCTLLDQLSGRIAPFAKLNEQSHLVGTDFNPSSRNLDDGINSAFISHPENAKINEQSHSVEIRGNSRTPSRFPHCSDGFRGPRSSATDYEIFVFFPRFCGILGDI